MPFITKLIGELCLLLPFSVSNHSSPSLLLNGLEELLGLGALTSDFRFFSSGGLL